MLNRILTVILVTVLALAYGCKRRIRGGEYCIQLEIFYFHHGEVFLSDSVETIIKDSTTIKVLIGNQVHYRDILKAYPPPYPKRVDSNRVKIWINFWVDPEGVIDSMVVWESDGDEKWQARVLNTLSEWRFKPDQPWRQKREGTVEFIFYEW